MANEFFKIGEASKAFAPSARFQVGDAVYDLSNLFDSFGDIKKAMKIAQDNPLSTEPMKLIGHAEQLLVGMANQQGLHPAIQQIAHPFMKAIGPMAEAAKQAVKLRLNAGHRLLQHPTITIPLNVLLATSTAGVQAQFVVQSPYLGSGGATHNIEAIWAITALETGALAQTGMSTAVFTKALFAGHDYVNASLSGIQSSTGAGVVSATQGWGFYNFASDKRDRACTTFSPWNLQGGGGVIGSIMRETGTVTLGMGNTGTTASSSNFCGTVQVHVKASLCGSPWNVNDVHAMFYPWRQQSKYAQKLFHSLPSKADALFNRLQAEMGGGRHFSTHGVETDDYSNADLSDTDGFGNE